MSLIVWAVGNDRVLKSAATSWRPVIFVFPGRAKARQAPAEPAAARAANSRNLRPAEKSFLPVDQ